MKKLIILLICGLSVATACTKKSQESTDKKSETKKNEVKKEAENSKKNEAKEEKKAEAPLVFPDVIAEVNGEKIKKEEVISQIEKMEKVYSQFGQKLNNENKKKLAKDILNKIIHS